MLAAEIEPAFAAGRRRGLREPVALDTDVERDGLDRALCRVVDLSPHGARLQTYSPLKRGATMWLTLPSLGIRATTIVWVKDFVAGCQFFESLTVDEFEALLDMDHTLRRN
ncbi:MAG: PilZ domain-containing protein [Sphingomonas sp.]